jgi:salicylate hydroxylase
MSLTDRKVHVVGAGIGGLAAACALARHGAEVTVLEQAPALTEIGAGIQISPNGWAVLAALKLDHALAPAATIATSVRLIDGISGREVTRLDLTRRPFRLFHRADLIATLAAAAGMAGATVTQGAEVADYDLGLATLRLADGSQRPAGLVIAADGARSRLRAALGAVESPRFSGQVAWRAIIAGDGGPPEVEVYMAPGRHLVSYPLRGGTLRNLVAVEERQAWGPDSWSAAGDPAHLRAAFGGFAPRVRGWLDAVTAPAIWGLHLRPVALLWGAAAGQGGIALLGDAAHPTLPFLAQGASLALEDAWVLAAMLDRHARLDAAIGAYQVARRARVLRAVKAAAGNARAYHLAGPARVLAHAGLRLGGRFAAATALRRLDWLYDYDATRV